MDFFVTCNKVKYFNYHPFLQNVPLTCQHIEHFTFSAFQTENALERFNFEMFCIHKK